MPPGHLVTTEADPSQRIYEMLITRAERAAQRIIYLQKRVKEL